MRSVCVDHTSDVLQRLQSVVNEVALLHTQSLSPLSPRPRVGLAQSPDNALDIPSALSTTVLPSAASSSTRMVPRRLGYADAFVSNGLEFERRPASLESHVPCPMQPTVAAASVPSLFLSQPVSQDDQHSLSGAAHNNDIGVSGSGQRFRPRQLSSGSNRGLVSGFYAGALGLAEDMLQ